ncbi:MAG: hypothetical protein AAGI22_21550 [Planctomycetota bacterium]
MGSRENDATATARPLRVDLRTGLRVAAALATLVLAALLVQGTAEALRSGNAWGWDETMHAELPAAQLVLHARAGELGAAAGVVHDCERYPFVVPVLLAAWQGVFGIGEASARYCGVWLFLLVGLPAVALLARTVAQRIAPDAREVATDAALLGALAAASSPLARRYAPTLFLEPAAVITMALALQAWLARGLAGASPRRARLRDVGAGVWLAATFFVKFNYGVMLLGAIGLDGLVELVRSRERLETLRSHAVVGLPLVLASAWWFLLPLPFGAEVASAHRSEFLDYVTSNTAMGEMPGWLRATHWLTGVAAHAFVLAAMLLGGAWLLVRERGRVSLSLAVVAACFVLPVVLHPFQLDRFLLPAALVLWVLSAVALARAAEQAPRATAGGAALLAGVCLVVPTFATVRWAGFPVADEGTPVRAYQARHVGHTLGLLGPPATNGLSRATHEGLLDLVADRVGPDATVAWLGQSSEMSPAALHLGLLARGGSAKRFLEGAAGPMDLDPVPRDVAITEDGAAVVAFARDFEHVVLTDPPDLKDRAGRRWIAELWHHPLLETDLFDVETLGTVHVERTLAEPRPVEVRLATRR